MREIRERPPGGLWPLLGLLVVAAATSAVLFVWDSEEPAPEPPLPTQPRLVDPTGDGLQTEAPRTVVGVQWEQPPGEGVTVGLDSPSLIDMGGGSYLSWEPLAGLGVSLEGEVVAWRGGFAVADATGSRMWMSEDGSDWVSAPLPAEVDLGILSGDNGRLWLVETAPGVGRVWEWVEPDGRWAVVGRVALPSVEGLNMHLLDASVLATSTQMAVTTRLWVELDWERLIGARPENICQDWDQTIFHLVTREESTPPAPPHCGGGLVATYRPRLVTPTPGDLLITVTDVATNEEVRVLRQKVEPSLADALVESAQSFARAIAALNWAIRSPDEALLVALPVEAGQVRSLGRQGDQFVLLSTSDNAAGEVWLSSDMMSWQHGGRTERPLPSVLIDVVLRSDGAGMAAAPVRAELPIDGGITGMTTVHSLWTSGNGADWTLVEPEAMQLTRQDRIGVVAGGDAGWVVIGWNHLNGSTVWFSPDTRTWTRLDLPNDVWDVRAAVGAGLIVVSGQHLAEGPDAFMVRLQPLAG